MKSRDSSPPELAADSSKPRGPCPTRPPACIASSDRETKQERAINPPMNQAGGSPTRPKRDSNNVRKAVVPRTGRVRIRRARVSASAGRADRNYYTPCHGFGLRVARTARAGRGERATLLSAGPPSREFPPAFFVPVTPRSVKRKPKKEKRRRVATIRPVIETCANHCPTPISRRRPAKVMCNEDAGGRATITGKRRRLPMPDGEPFADVRRMPVL